MNKVISGYFDDAHRGLQRQQTGAMKEAPSSLQLPPLRPNSGGPGGGGGEEGDESWQAFNTSLRQSASMGSIEFSQEQAGRGIQKERLEAAKSEAAALGNDGEWSPKHLSTNVERALALELWASRQPALQTFLKEDPAHCLGALCASKHGLLDVAMDLTAPGAALWAPMRAARLAITIMHGSEDFGERDLKVGQALRQVTWPLPSAPCASADEAREAMLKRSEEHTSELQSP